MFDAMAFKQNDSKAQKRPFDSLGAVRSTCPLSAVTRPRVLNVHNRKVRLNKACGSVADCTFEELCDRVSLGRDARGCPPPPPVHAAPIFQPLGASDYLEMSRLFDTVFIRHVPRLTLNQKTQARRLITLVDALYEHKVRKPLLSDKNRTKQTPLPVSFQVRVVILADHPLEDIFNQDQGDHGHEESHVLMDDLGLKRARALTFLAAPISCISSSVVRTCCAKQEEASSLSIFSGEEERFAFQRTVSRLTEMQTEEYWIGGDRSAKAQA